LKNGEENGNWLYSLYTTQEGINPDELAKKLEGGHPDDRILECVITPESTGLSRCYGIPT